MPLGITHSIISAAASSSDQTTRHIANLVVFRLYLCLRYCEYTNCTGYLNKVQIQLLLNFLFFVEDTILPPDASIKKFHHTNQIVITLYNQKNATQWENVSHFLSESPSACPVQAGVNIFFLLQEQGCNPSTPVNEYSTPQGLHSVSDLSIITVVRAE